MNERAVVKELNDNLLSSSACEEDYFQYLEYVETPIGDYVKWYGVIIWDSENDYREDVEGGNKEDLRGFLLREMKKLAKVLHGAARSADQ